MGILERDFIRCKRKNCIEIMNFVTWTLVHKI